MIYRIYTEMVPAYYQMVIETVTREFSGFTVFTGQGMWQGEREKSMVIEIVVTHTAKSVQDDIVNTLARHIKVINKQNSVMVTCQAVEATFV
jgi:hypothetical protein